jgi:hypothetical protein
MQVAEEINWIDDYELSGTTAISKRDERLADLLATRSGH